MAKVVPWRLWRAYPRDVCADGHRSYFDVRHNRRMPDADGVVQHLLRDMLLSYVQLVKLSPRRVLVLPFALVAFC